MRCLSTPVKEGIAPLSFNKARLIGSVLSITAFFLAEVALGVQFAGYGIFGIISFGSFGALVLTLALSLCLPGKRLSQKKASQPVDLPKQAPLNPSTPQLLRGEKIVEAFKQLTESHLSQAWSLYNRCKIANHPINGWHRVALERGGFLNEHGIPTQEVKTIVLEEVGKEESLQYAFQILDKIEFLYCHDHPIFQGLKHLCRTGEFSSAESRKKLKANGLVDKNDQITSLVKEIVEMNS